MNAQAQRVLKKKRIGVLWGGTSREREVSLRSGKNVLVALQRRGLDAVGIDVDAEIARNLRNKKIEVAFVVLHGKPGEDGTIQGMLELMGIPYAGSGVLASALALNKLASKKIFCQEGITTPPYAFLPRNDSTSIPSLTKRLGLPLVIKPLEEGSSYGVAILHKSREIVPSLRKQHREYGDLLAEKFIPGMNATVGILGCGLTTRALPVLELVPKKEFYDLEAKYTPGLTEFVIPARLPKRLYQELQDQALSAHHALGCHGFSRVDAIVDMKKGKAYILEVNTIPGMTNLSDLPAEAKAAGISYDDLVLEMLESALKRL
jgi:D-alanine-D-alanine ligase